MQTNGPREIIPTTRAALVTRYTNFLHAAGAPVEALLSRAGVPDRLLEHPASVIRLEPAFRFAELACRSLGTEHLGVHVGLATSFDDLGPYGEVLRRSPTLGEYLRRGIRFYNLLITGQRFWLSRHGPQLRLNLTSIGEPGVGRYQSELESLIISIRNIRHALPGWTPREISLSYRSPEPLPDIDVFSGARVLRGFGQTYITIPRRMLPLRYGSKRYLRSADPTTPSAQPLPEHLAGLVRHQITCLLAERALNIETVTESLGLSRRSLQRELASQRLTFSGLLSDVRMGLAVQWLEDSDKPVAEIAFDLGYRDAANFTRAFRRYTGVAPQTFRATSHAT